MGIANRDKDASEQRECINITVNAVTGQSTLMYSPLIPWDCTLQAIKMSASGLSGQPVVNFQVQRFIVGSGQTLITGGATNLTLTTDGTSGPQSWVLAASGSSFLNLLAGDIFRFVSPTANTAFTNATICAVIKATQDIKNHFNLSL